MVPQTIADALPEADLDHQAAHIAVLAQLALRSPDAFELKSDVITAFLLKKVLMTGNEADPVSVLQNRRRKALLIFIVWA